MPIVLKSGSLNLLEPSGPVEACHGIALLFLIEEIGMDPSMDGRMVDWFDWNINIVCKEIQEARRMVGTLWVTQVQGMKTGNSTGPSVSLFNCQMSFC